MVASALISLFIVPAFGLYARQHMEQVSQTTPVPAMTSTAKVPTMAQAYGAL